MVEKTFFIFSNFVIIIIYLERLRVLVYNINAMNFVLKTFKNFDDYSIPKIIITDIENRSS